MAAGGQQAKETCVTMDGMVVGINRNSATVEIDNGSGFGGIVSGRLMQHRIRILTGDKVRVEMTPYDLTKGRIVYRSK